MSAAIVSALWAASESPLALLAVKATLALLAAFVLLGAARAASASLRHLVAAATFAVLLLLPLFSALVPARAISVPAPVAAAAQDQAPRAVAVAAPRPAVGARDVSASAVPATARVAVTAAYAVYLAGAAGMALSLLAGMVRLRRIRNRADVSVAGTRLANDAARADGRRGGIEVAVSAELAVPVTFGWTRPVILLPAEAAEWTDPELGRAIRHELEHIARGDWATQVMARVALAVYWPHPFSWLLWRRLRLEAERACDDAVIRSHGQPETYAEQLVALARRLRGRGAVPALSMATRGTLGLRVDAILAAGLRRGPRSRTATLAVGTAALGCLLAIAPVRVMGSAPVPVDDALEFEGRDPQAVALLEASERGDVRAMRRLMEQGARADAVVEGDGSPLIAAARAGQLEAMALLIAGGANVNRGVRGDGSPLIGAAREGHLEAVRLLLDKGADIDAGVPGDGNALIMAAGAGQTQVVAYLLDAGAGLEKVVPGDENALIHACEAGRAEVVRLLLDRGADVHARVWAERGPDGGGEWRTPLSMARRNGHEEVVRILRAAGARE